MFRFEKLLLVILAIITLINNKFEPLAWNITLHFNVTCYLLLNRKLLPYTLPLTKLFWTEYQEAVPLTAADRLDFIPVWPKTFADDKKQHKMNILLKKLLNNLRIR